MATTSITEKVKDAATDSEAVLSTLNNSPSKIPSTLATKLCDPLESTNSLGVHSTLPTASRSMKSLLTNKFTQACVNVNSLRIQQASQTTLNTDSLGTHQSSQPSVNTDSLGTHQSSQPSVNTGKTVNTMPIPRNTAVTVSSTNIKNPATLSSSSILINLNNGVQSNFTLNQIVNNKTLPVNTSKTVGPTDVEVTEQSFQVTIQPVQKLDPPLITNLDPPTELENIQVKIEESSVVEELQSSTPMSEEHEQQRVENSLVEESEENADNCNKDKMSETDFKFFKCGICDVAFINSVNLEKHVHQHKIFQSETIKCGYCEEIFYSKRNALHHLNHTHGIICKKPKAGMEEVNLPTYESDGKSPKTIRVIRTKIPKCEVCKKIFPNLERFAEHKQKSICAYVWYCCLSCRKKVGKETCKEVPLPKELICKLCHQSGNQSKENTDTVMEQEKQGDEMILGVVQPSIVEFGSKKKDENKQGNEMILSVVQPCIVKFGCKKKDKSRQEDEMILDEVQPSIVEFGCKKKDENKQGDEMILDKAQPSIVEFGCKKKDENKQKDEKLTDKKCKKKVKKFYNCLDCGKSYAEKDTYEMHLKMLHSTIKQHKCDLCEQAYVHPSSLRLHKRLHSKMETFACDKCPKTFKLKGFLKKHQNVHEPARFQCDVCGRKLKSKPKLIEHKRLHSGEKPFLCEICGKGFHSRMARIFHVDTHNPSSKRLCEICGKLYTCTSSLRLHQKLHRIHNGSDLKERFCILPWVCEICGKRFSKRLRYENHKLNVHERKNKKNKKRSHLEDNQKKKKTNSDCRSICDICGKSFCSKSALRSHVAVVHRENPDDRIICDICGKTFSSKSTLSSHSALHKGQMQISCEKCNMVMHKHSLKRHMLRMHKTNV
ncbi:zinc finger protein 728-like [Saccostrea echinata]|uniref:zinc finger protein 728-like n=1 Tax=Saccostrea echinata TaxID=191078 RepID=UPI002A7EDB9B|nr:zinc finger protein 728-like [Saccostrea echinata]